MARCFSLRDISCVFMMYICISFLTTRVFIGNRNREREREKEKERERGEREMYCISYYMHTCTTTSTSLLVLVLRAVFSYYRMFSLTIE